MLVSTPVMTAAPHQDIRGTLFLVNRDYRVSANYFPVVTDTDSEAVLYPVMLAFCQPLPLLNCH